MEIEIRDAVHSFVRLREKEAKLVNTRALQRLRGIRQLALASLVYPGAVHTRFDHTLGVTHVAGQMAAALELDDDAVELIRYAALLHDIGHGPFSHVSEYALERYADRSKLAPNQKKEKIHELVTATMIQNDDEIVRILGKDDCEKISRLLGTGHGEPVVRSVVSGPLDADKQDYLLRDSHFCGVQYGVFDLHQLHRSLVAKGDEHDRHLMIKPDGIHAVEQYVLAKYYLTTNVYRHKVRLISDQMIVRAIILGIQRDNIDELRALYSFDNSPEFAHNYCGWDDARFMEAFGRQKKGTRCGILLERLQRRQLLKRVFQGKPKDFSAGIREGLLDLVEADKSHLRAAIEQDIAEAVCRESGEEIDRDCVILHAFDIKSVKEMSRNDEAGILVARPKPVSFEDESSLFASINEGFEEEFIEVYAPVTWATRADRERICAQLREPVRKVIQKHCTKATQELEQ